MNLNKIILKDYPVVSLSYLTIGALLDLDLSAKWGFVWEYVFINMDLSFLLIFFSNLII